MNFSQRVRLFLFFCLCCPQALLAQSAGLDEIVVTASRLSDYDRVTTPVIHLKKQPDYMLISTNIESDSRSATLRAEEIEASLASLSKRAAKTDNIELGLTRTIETGDDEIEYVVPFTLDEVVISNGYRPDTSRVGLVVKSPVLPSDESVDVIYERIESFIDSIPMSGRAVVTSSGDMNFSLKDLQQYREPLLTLLAEDVKRLKALFGEDHRVYMSGFEEQVRWRVLAPMQLAIFFPYTTSMESD